MKIWGSETSYWYHLNNILVLEPEAHKSITESFWTRTSISIDQKNKKSKPCGHAACLENETIWTLFLFGIRNTKEASTPFVHSVYFRTETQQQLLSIEHGVSFGTRNTNTILETIWTWYARGIRTTATLTPFEYNCFLIRHTEDKSCDHAQFSGPENHLNNARGQKQKWDRNHLNDKLSSDQKHTKRKRKTLRKQV